MERRAFLSALTSGSLVASRALAQPSARPSKIGYLSLNAPANPHLRAAFRQGLRDLGYVEGRNVLVEFRDAGGQIDRLPALAAELVALRVTSS